jgi:hypothetical protein
MFRFVLQVAFIRRVLHLRLVRVVLFVILVGSLIAGLIYAVAIFHAVTERNRAPHVDSRHTS